MASSVVTVGLMGRASKALGLLLPRSRTTLFRAFREDRFLSVVSLVLFLTACIPLLLTPFLPFSDLPLNTLAVETMWEVALGREPSVTYHQINLGPVPYWVGYAIALVFGRAFGPLIAAKLLTALIIALLPLSTMRLLLALGRSPRVGLWAFALVWQQNLYAGWLSYLVGISLVGFVLAWIIEAETIGDGFRIAPYGILVALSHIQATWLLAVAGGLLCLTTGRVGHRVLVHLAAGSGAALSVGFWLFGQLSTTSSVRSAFSFGWHSPAEKLSKVFFYTLDNFTQPSAIRVAAIAFVVLVLGPLALTQLPQRVRVDRLSPWILIGSAGLLYVLLWWEVGGPIWHWYTYPRYAAVFVMWLLLVPAPRASRWFSFALLPGIFSTLLLNWEVAWQFAAFGQRTRPFVEVLGAIPERAAVLPFVLDDNDSDPDLRLPPYHQLHAYTAAVGHGYMPYTWDVPSTPVSKRIRGRPAPGWGGRFSMDDHGRHYDYLLVQGFQHGDPVQRATSKLGYTARLVLERARWRLYKVEKP